MGPDLVHDPGDDPHPSRVWRAKARATTQRVSAGRGVLPAQPCPRPSRPAPAPPAAALRQRHGADAAGGDPAADQRQVDLLHHPPAQLVVEPLPGVAVAGEEHAAAGLEVEPLRGPPLARIERGLGALRVAGHHGVGQRARLAGEQRVDRHAGRLVAPPEHRPASTRSGSPESGSGGPRAGATVAPTTTCPGPAGWLAGRAPPPAPRPWRKARLTAARPSPSVSATARSRRPETLA